VPAGHHLAGSSRAITRAVVSLISTAAIALGAIVLAAIVLGATALGVIAPAAEAAPRSTNGARA
jgi:hypothetical protein